MRDWWRAPAARAAMAISTGAILWAACGSAAPTDAGVGTTAPDFSLPESGGGEVHLADFEGRPVLLYFHMAVG